jgi:hypothetical protein
MKCDACTLAFRDPLTDRFNADCTECDARAIARTAQYRDAIYAGAMTAGYRNILQTAFGEHWITGSIRVEHWTNRIQSFVNAFDDSGA